MDSILEIRGIAQWKILQQVISCNFYLPFPDIFSSIFAVWVQFLFHPCHSFLVVCCKQEENSPDTNITADGDLFLGELILNWLSNWWFWTLRWSWNSSRTAHLHESYRCVWVCWQLSMFWWCVPIMTLSWNTVFWKIVYFSSSALWSWFSQLEAIVKWRCSVFSLERPKIGNISKLKVILPNVNPRLLCFS